MVVAVVLGWGAGGKGGRIVHMWRIPAGARSLPAQPGLVQGGLVGMIHRRPPHLAGMLRRPWCRRHDPHPVRRRLGNRREAQVATIAPQVRRAIQALLDEDRVARPQAHRLVGAELEEAVWSRTVKSRSIVRVVWIDRIASRSWVGSSGPCASVGFAGSTAKRRLCAGK